jgi:putative thiamine transport system ATP-binding protein
MSGLVLEDVAIRAGGLPLLDGLSLAVAPGEIVTLMGPSGCGKSSLLRWLAGVVPPGVAGCGRVRLGDRRIDALPPESRRLGLMLQEPLLFPHLSVLGNLLFAIPRRHRGRARRRAAAETALATVGLAGLGPRDPATLSGGQRSRVALVRCLLAEPHALLLDEPFASLDRARRAEVRDVVFARVRAAGLPTLLVTHDPADATASAGRVIEPWLPQRHA